MNFTDAEYENSTLRGLKIVRKACRKMIHHAMYRTMHREIDKAIKKRQAKQRDVFPPNYINRAQDRRNKSS